MIRHLAAGILLSLSTSAVPQSIAPRDAVAESKFPAADAQFVDALAEMNRQVNKSITYEDDQKHYGVADLWVMFPPDGKGDCEDYALTKLGVLSMTGFPIVSNAKIVTVVAKAKNKVEGHAILAVRLKSGAVAYLDSGIADNAEPMTREELVALGYQFFDWRA